MSVRNLSDLISVRIRVLVRVGLGVGEKFAKKFDVGDGCEIEVVEKFSYPGDNLGVDGTANLAVTRICGN